MRSLRLFPRSSHPPLRILAHLLWAFRFFLSSSRELRSLLLGGVGGRLGELLGTHRGIRDFLHLRPHPLGLLCSPGGCLISFFLTHPGAPGLVHGPDRLAVGSVGCVLGPLRQLVQLVSGLFQHGDELG